MYVNGSLVSTTAFLQEAALGLGGFPMLPWHSQRLPAKPIGPPVQVDAVVEPPLAVFLRCRAFAAECGRADPKVGGGKIDAHEARPVGKGGAVHPASLPLIEARRAETPWARCEARKQEKAQ